MGKSEREQTTIRLPAELKEKLQQEAMVKGLSLNSYILLLIDTGRSYQH
jgi:predicted HicB family RNase H-like nuclease